MGEGDDRLKTVEDVICEEQARLVGHALNELRSWGIDDWQLAEDVVQDAAMSTLRRERDTDDPIRESARAYLYAAIRNRAGDMAKRKRPALWPEMEILTAPAVPLCDVEARVDQVNALRQCPEDSREALYRVLALGETYRETAGDMGRSPGTVASWIRRNRKRLAEMLAVIGCAGLAYGTRQSVRWTEPSGWAQRIVRGARALSAWLSGQPGTVAAFIGIALALMGVMLAMILRERPTKVPFDVRGGDLLDVAFSGRRDLQGLSVAVWHRGGAAEKFPCLEQPGREATPESWLPSGALGSDLSTGASAA